MEEEWRPVKGFEGWYEVSNLSRIRSTDRIIQHKADRFSERGKIQVNDGKIRIPALNNRGYYYVNLYKNSVPYKRYVHRMVAEAFIPNPDNKKEVNHIDGDAKNNDISNLEWCTKMENINHAWGNGLVLTKKKIKSTNLRTGEETFYESVASAGRALGIAHSGISLQLTRKTKSCNGCVWDYV